MTEQAGTTPGGTQSPGTPGQGKTAPAKMSGCKIIGIVLAVMFCGLIALSILSALLLPGIERALNRARVVNCGNNLSQLMKMQSIYSSVHGGPMKLYPHETGGGFWLKLNRIDPPLIEDSVVDIYFCPTSGTLPTQGTTEYLGPGRDANDLGNNAYIGGDADLYNWHDPGSDVPTGNFLRKSGAVVAFEGTEATRAHGSMIS